MPRKTKAQKQEEELVQVIQNAMQLSRAMLSNRLGTQFDGQRDLYKTFGYVQQPTYQDYRNLFDRQGIASRIVEKFADDTWNNPPVIIDGEARSDQPDQLTPFLKAWNELVDRVRVYKVLRQADVMLGFSRYAVIFFGASAENLNLSMEVKVGDGLFYLNAFDEQQASITNFVTDNNPRFGMPATYSINFNVDGGVPMPLGGAVDSSRCLHIIEDALGSRVYGRPRLQTIINRLFDLEKVTGGGAEAAWLSVYKGMIIKAREGAQLPAADSPERKVMDDQINNFMNRIQRYVALSEADIDSLGVDEVKIGDIYDVIKSDIAGSKGIPQRILYGSEVGHLASTQDTQEWETVIRARRTNFAEPEMLRPTINWCIKYQVVPVPESGKFGVEWKPVYQMTQEEEGKYALDVAQGAAAVTGGVPDQAIDTNEWRKLIHLPPRDEQPVIAPAPKPIPTQPVSQPSGSNGAH